ncbi:hypothetical protein B0H11DRAFT_2116066, partial [Mycena galericulata]
MPTNNSFPRIAIVDVPGKGRGVITQQRIPRGTLIISEKPKIILPNNPATIDDALSALSAMDRAFLLSFPCGRDEDPIRGRLKHFTPCGYDAAGLCATICRVNHTCFSPEGSPNSAYTWNEKIEEEELRAIKEISEGQEIEVSYMDVENMVDGKTPLEVLQEKFGFECSCQGCARPQAERLASNQRILRYNEFVRAFPWILDNDPLQILRELEKQILIISEEGYTSEIGPRASDAFQLCASYGDAVSAQQWEEICRDNHALYHGIHSDSFKTAQKRAEKPQEYFAWQMSGIRRLKGPVCRFMFC